MTSRRSTPPPPHPMQGIALASFRDTPSHDAESLASYLGGSSLAYVAIAAEVLENLQATGKVRPDPGRLGAYVLATKELTLADEAYIRRGCRRCLKGLHVKLADGRVVEVLASRWDEHGKLMISVRPGATYISAELAIVVGVWPARCCRQLKTRLREVLAARELSKSS